MQRANPKSETRNPNSRVFGFRISGFEFSGWWLRAESKPVRVGLIAAAKPVPALLIAWTFHTPVPYEPPLPRGETRLALLCRWGIAG